MSPLDRVLSEAKVLICVGSGGVGKTTTASAIAYLAAVRGQKVLVLTIDPSKRLKSTMGLSETEEIIRIQRPDIKGELWASVIDNKKTFDDFVLRASKYSESAKKILNNKLYLQLSTTLSGSQEFTALEKLYSAVESGKYDLVVLDTPPTKHAIDFLESPQKLSAIFQDSVAKWFRDPEGKEQSFIKRIVASGTAQVLRILENLTGSEFMKELAEFFRSIQQWQGRLEGRIADVHRLLVSPRTQFLLVTSLDAAKMQEIQFFEREIEKGGYHLAGILINRAFPHWMGATVVAENLGKSPIEAKMRAYYLEKLQLASKLEAFEFSRGRFVAKIPELRENISDLETVANMAQIIAEVTCAENGSGNEDNS
jgi:anion-transporting  ArsA/GET3 family ATPase